MNLVIAWTVAAMLVAVASAKSLASPVWPLVLLSVGGALALHSLRLHQRESDDDVSDLTYGGAWVAIGVAMVVLTVDTIR